MAEKGKTKERYFYSWEEFEKDTEKLAVWAKNQNFRAIYGVPRGGVVLAISLSHRLNLPAEFSKEKIDERTLLVDDISDSGKTLLALEKALSFKPVVATIFYHEDTMRKPDFCVRKKEKWVIFPWETEETSKYDNRNL